MDEKVPLGRGGSMPDGNSQEKFPLLCDPFPKPQQTTGEYYREAIQEHGQEWRRGRHKRGGLRHIKHTCSHKITATKQISVELLEAAQVGQTPCRKLYFDAPSH